MHICCLCCGLFTSWVDYALCVGGDDQRVLNVVQTGLFHRTVSELDLGNIQDVSSNIKGVMPDDV